MLNNPLFSVAIPTYNRLDLLKRAVGSILCQTYKNMEIVILNNASTDGTKQWLDDLSIQYPTIKIIHRSINIGCTENLKSVPLHINGEYLVVLSDDDWFEATFVEEAVKDFCNNDDATVWHCRTNLFHVVLDKKITSQIEPPIEQGLVYIKKWLLGERHPYFCSTVFKVQTLKETGGFLGNTISADSSARCLCAAKGSVLFNFKILATYSAYQGNTSTTSSYKEWLEACCETYDLIEKHIGSEYKYLCAHSAARVCKWLRLLRCYNLKCGLRGFVVFFRRYHIYFLFNWLRRLSVCNYSGI